MPKLSSHAYKLQLKIKKRIKTCSNYVVVTQNRVTWGKAPPFGDDLSLTYLFASTSEKSYIYVTNYMLCV